MGGTCILAIPHTESKSRRGKKEKKNRDGELLYVTAEVEPSELFERGVKNEHVPFGRWAGVYSARCLQRCSPHFVGIQPVCK